MAFIIVPWLVHGIIMPILFQMIALTRTNVDRILIHTLIFVVFSAILIPLGGVSAFGFIMLLFALAVGANLHPPDWLQTGIAALVSVFFWPVIAATVAACIGAMAHLLRGEMVQGRGAAAMGNPRLRSDLLGAVFAAAFATVIILVATPMGLFDRQIDSGIQSGEYTATAPQLLTTVFIAVTAFSPHLAMIGYDLFKSDNNVR